MKTKSTHRFAALIAARDEKERIHDTVVSVARLAEVVGVIVADDGSVDGTAKEAMRAGALVVSNRHSLGKGQAMELAAETLEKVKPFGSLDGVLLLDGDLGESSQAASALLVPLLANKADLVIGILPPPPGKAGFGLAKSLARDGIFEFGNGFESSAPLSGQRALTIDCLNRVRPFAKKFAMEVDMTISALQQKQRVLEVPVEMEHRYTGRNLSGFLHRGQQFFQINRLINSYYKKKS